MMMTMGKKILYIFGGLYAPNGMSSIISEKINYLAEYTDNKMYMVLTERPNIPHYYKLSEKVNWVNFDINFDDIDSMSFIKKFFFFILKQYKFKKQLVRYMMELRPDIIVSVARREINFITKVKDGSKKIAEIHFARTFYRKINIRCLPEFVNKWISCFWMNRLLDNLKKLDRFIVLTHEDSKNWPELNNVVVIPNFISSIPNYKSDRSSKAVIAVGRYSWQKGFDLLIEAWAIVNKKHPDWILNIYGGGDNNAFQCIVENKGLSDVIHCNPAVSDIFNRYYKSSFFVLSSRYEGLPLVIIEAMGAGLPVVSFACPCGPRDMIRDGYNGFLVDNGDVEQLAIKICYLIENGDIVNVMGENAISSIKDFNKEAIMNRWIKLFEEL